MLKRFLFICLCAFAVCTASFSLAEAADITAECLLYGADKQVIHCLHDGDYQTRWSAAGREARLYIDAPEGLTIGSVYLKFFNEACPYDVEVRGEDGTWEKVFSSEGDYLVSFAALPESAEAVRVRACQNNMRLALAEVTVYSPGEVPGSVQRWKPPHEKAELLLISAHPDDEILFMGGTIPYYAGEMQRAVQVAYLVPATPYRKLELLDGLWLCGCRNYPDIGSFPDRFSTTLASMYRQEGWGRAAVLRHVVNLYRRYQPEVVVTHDVNGEYGHGAHRVAADAAQQAVALAADTTYQDKRLTETMPWQVQKLYLHLYEEGALRMDWRVPLARFGGRTAFDMAEAAFACHVSQQHTEYKVEDFGPYDNAKFGLAFSAVGEDVNKNDFFENVTPSWRMLIVQ